MTDDTKSDSPADAATTKPDAAARPDAATTKPDAAARPDATKPKPDAAAKSGDKPPPSSPPKPVAKGGKDKDDAPLPEFEKGISERAATRFGDRVQVRFVKENRVGLQAAREDVKEVARYLRDELNFDHAESVTGVDYPADGEIEVVYHLGSYTDDSMSGQVLELATRAPREDVPNPGKDSTTVPSLREVFYSVEFHERECFEMLGVRFDGHPDNRRLLLPEDWADLPPLRRDFAIKGR